MPFENVEIQNVHNFLNKSLKDNEYFIEYLELNHNSINIEFYNLLINKLLELKDYEKLDYTIKFCMKRNLEIDLNYIINKLSIISLLTRRKIDSKYTKPYITLSYILSQISSLEELDPSLLERIFNLVLFHEDEKMIVLLDENQKLKKFIDSLDTINNMLVPTCRIKALTYFTKTNNLNSIIKWMNHPHIYDFFKNENIFNYLKIALENNNIEIAKYYLGWFNRLNHNMINNLEMSRDHSDIIELLSLPNIESLSINNSENFIIILTECYREIFKASFDSNNIKILEFLFENADKCNVDLHQIFFGGALRDIVNYEYYESILFLIDYDIELLTRSFDHWINFALNLISILDDFEQTNNIKAEKLRNFVNKFFSNHIISECLEKYSYKNLDNNGERVIGSENVNKNLIEKAINIFRESRKKSANKSTSNYRSQFNDESDNSDSSEQLEPPKKKFKP